MYSWTIFLNLVEFIRCHAGNSISLHVGITPHAHSCFRALRTARAPMYARTKMRARIDRIVCTHATFF